MTTKARLFEYVIIWHPTEQQEKEGAKAKILVDLQRILEKNVTSAQTLAARAIPSEYIDQVDQVEILFRVS
jgi:hypothetical protein